MSAVKLKVNTSELPKSRLAIEVEIPGSRSQESYDEAISNLSRSVKLPGFRKGKVPKAVLLQQIGIIRIKATAIEKLIEKIWRETLDQESINALCEPQIKDGFESLLEEFKPGETLKVTFETDISPNPKLKATKGLTAEVETVNYDPSKVDELIEQSRKQLATLIPVEKRPAEKGDVAVVSFKGTYKDNGSEIKGGSSESMDIDLEKGQMIPGFIEGIIGMSLNEQKMIECDFPKDYVEKDAQGRKAIFDLTLKDLKQRELPPLDDSFAKQASDKKTFAELKDDLEERLKKDTELKNEGNRHDALLKELVSQLEVDLPETLIQQEIRNLIEQTASNFAEQGMDVKSLFTEKLVKSLMESSRGEAEENLRKSLALKALAETEEITVEDKSIEEKMQEVKKQLSDEKQINDERLKEAIREDLLREKLLGWLEENNTIKEMKPSDADQKLQPASKAKSKSTAVSKSQVNKTKNTKSTPKTPKS
ncbi:trigger factor [Prochlorococcus sp. MIT 1341]|uniref:trigger factor n=1 Tax=Prochlorococcus sp. MIT 1341 TaxID=3096221 RepID=UPI002A74A665|nr:trigger factor [Prochlorococcus sp. MIT 1341]